MEPVCIFIRFYEYIGTLSTKLVILIGQVKDACIAELIFGGMALWGRCAIPVAKRHGGSA